MAGRQGNRGSLAATLGTNLRAARKERGLTQAQVAEGIGLSNEFYARLERGRAVPSVETLVKLVKVLGVSADELLGAEIAPARASAALDSLPRERAQLARRIMALKPSFRRFIGQLLQHGETYLDG